MQIAFYQAKYGREYDKIIAIATFSKYSHCELIFSDGICGSASPRDGGVRLKNIEIDNHWCVFELLNTNGSPITPQEESVIRYWFYINQGQSYDWWGALGSFIRLDLTSPGKKYCSNLISILLGLEPIITPGGLFRLLKKKNLINV